MSEDRLRLDIWLWRTRHFKARSDATTFIGKRGVRISRSGQTRKTDKPAANVVEGDVLTFGKGGKVIVIEVLGLPARRGPAPEAQTFYRSVEEETDEC